MAARLSKVEHVDAPAVMLVTYGNRAVDDTFIELADMLESKGWHPWAPPPWSRTIRL